MAALSTLVWRAREQLIGQHETPSKAHRAAVEHAVAEARIALPDIANGRAAATPNSTKPSPAPMPPSPTPPRASTANETPCTRSSASATPSPPASARCRRRSIRETGHPDSSARPVFAVSSPTTCRCAAGLRRRSRRRSAVSRRRRSPTTSTRACVRSTAHARATPVGSRWCSPTSSRRRRRKATSPTARGSPPRSTSSPPRRACSRCSRAPSSPMTWQLRGRPGPRSRSGATPPP